MKHVSAEKGFIRSKDHWKGTKLRAWKVSKYAGRFPDRQQRDKKTIWKVSRWPGMFLDGLEICQIACKILDILENSHTALTEGNQESFQMSWKVSWWSGQFPDGMKKFPCVITNFQIVWTISRWPGKFPDGLDSFQMAWKFPYGLESFQVAWKVSRLSGNFLYFTKTFQVALLPCYLGFSASAWLMVIRSSFPPNN